MSLLVGIHPVREALRAGRPLDRVVILRGTGGARLQEVIDLCRAQKVPVRFETKDQIDRQSAGAQHQGVIGYGAVERYASLDETCASGGLHVALDGIEDPHNLGAIIRTAHAAGAVAVVIPERRAVGITESVARTAAGALAHIDVVRVTNLNRALEDLKKKGYWIYGLDESGSEAYYQVEYGTPSAFVLGAEGRGLHEQTAKHCDLLVRIPMPTSGVASLNVSVAAGIVLFEWRRRVGQPK